MNDSYLHPNSNVLRNLLNIVDEKALDLAEAELSRANMMLIYEEGFLDFTINGIKIIHKALFSDIYEWAGEFRKINIQKREELLGGRSVWYSNAVDIDKELKDAWNEINKVKWGSLNKVEFAINLAHTFPKIWQVHPFREGNTRTIVMLMTFFTERYNYYFDQELLAKSAGYVRNSFVMASIGEHAEFEHLEKILLDTVRDTPIEICLDEAFDDVVDNEKYKKYYIANYTPKAHEYREEIACKDRKL